MQFTTACITAMLVLASTHKTLAAPVETSVALQDSSSELGELNPINAEPTKRRRARANGKDLSDAPELDRSNVSFDLPSELFNKTIKTVTQVSQSFSRLIMNSARRYSRFALFFKPILGDALVVKGFEDPTTTTTMRTTTEDSDKLNEV
ncbi:uncharacterized protein LOC132796701 isoform X2 [Drosophila nasuta]|uniref:uncharacterized protein LOC132796701 isoform X2 n=1 Tax=Drosophila nasuta TaxID=42062 RepID=UPI00295E26E9|nr:uncharacterized protein LOC132796701 isoform X2 [Drosophila nasuta]